MSRRTILKILNKLLKEEHGKALKMDELLTNSGIDSFGYAIFWCGVEEKFGIKFSKEDELRVNYKELTMSKLIDTIIEKAK